MATSKVKLSTTHLLKGLDELRNQTLLCDVHLVAECATFPAHRVVLAAASPYFQAMFTGGFRENQMNEITLNCMSSEGLNCVLDAIYTGELSLSKENLCDVLPVASQLQLTKVAQHCERFLKTNISAQNCLSFLRVAEKYDLQEVVDVCNEFVLKKFDTVSESTEFTDLSKAKLCNYISDDHLKISHGEIEVFRATIKWFQANQNASVHRDDKSSVLSELIQHVRFALIPRNLLWNEILTCRLVSDNTEVMRMVTEALQFQSNDNIFLQPFQKGKQFQPRGVQNLVVIGSTTRNVGIMTIRQIKMHMLNANGDKLFHAQFSEQVLPRGLFNSSTSVVTEGNYLFMFGADAEYFRPTAQRFDVKTNTWLDLRQPPYASVCTAAALLEGKIYLLGGMHLTKGSENTVKPSDLSSCVS